MPRHVIITPEMRTVLERSTITSTTLTLPNQLERKLYEAVNKAIAAAGGQWNRGRQCHVFTGDSREKLGLALETGSVRCDKQFYQAFYTPVEVARRMVAELNARTPLNGLSVLEPSAGGGALADALLDTGAKVTCVELNPEAVALLRGKGHHVIGADFLSTTLADLHGPFDAIVMNPPFSRNQDIKHVRHAYSMLKPGGPLVAITSPHWTFASEREAADFREFLDSLSYSEHELPEGTFAESGTPIRTVALSLRKPADEPMPVIIPPMETPETPEVAASSPTSRWAMATSSGPPSRSSPSAATSTRVAPGNRKAPKASGISPPPISRSSTRCSAS